MVSRLRLRGGRRVTSDAPPPNPDITLAPLSFSANFFDVDVATGSVLADLTPAPEVGETRAFNPPTTSADQVYLAPGGNQILRGLEAWAAGTIPFSVVRTLAGATNSPLATPWDVTLYSPGDMPVLGVSDKWYVTKAADSGYEAGEVPVTTVLNNTTIQAEINLIVSWHENIVGDTLLCFEADGAYGSVTSVDAMGEGNSVAITAPTWQEVINPNTGLTVPLYGWWFKLLKPTENGGTINIRGRANTAGGIVNATISRAYPFYPRATAYDVLKTVSANDAHPTANYKGLTALTQALQFKKENAALTVWIEILDNPAIGWGVSEINPNHVNATVHTKVFGTAGSDVVLGNYGLAGFKPGIDGIWWENVTMNLSAMGNGSSAYFMPGGRNDSKRVKLWGVRIIGGEPEAAGAGYWSGSGAAILYKRRQPEGFYFYPGSSEQCEIIAGFSGMTGVPTFGWAYTTLNLYNTAAGVAGTCCENNYGATMFCDISQVGGRQAGLRAYNPAIRITYSGGAAYKAIEKVTTNGNIALGSPGESTKLSIPLTITNGGAGYEDGTWDGSGATETLPARPRFTVTGGSGTGALVEVLVVGGVCTKAYISKSTTAGSGYQPGDVLTLVQKELTGTTPATITLGATLKFYEGTSAATAVVTREFLIESGQARQVLIDKINSWPGWVATDLNPDHDLDLTFLTYNAQPAAGVPVANNFADKIALQTWTGATFDLSVGADIHSNCIAVSGVRQNLAFKFNRFHDYVESAPFSFGKAAKPNGVIVKWNSWYDSTKVEFPTLSEQQGYWRGQSPHLVFANNTVVANNTANGAGGGAFLGTNFEGGAAVELRNNLMDSLSWSITRRDDVSFYNNALINATQTQVNNLVADPSADGDSEGLAGLPLASVVPGAATGNFTPLSVAQRGDGSWAGSTDGSGNYAGIAPAP